MWIEDKDAILQYSIGDIPEASNVIDPNYLHEDGGTKIFGLGMPTTASYQCS